MKLTLIQELAVHAELGEVRFALRRVEDGGVVGVHRATHASTEDPANIMDRLDAERGDFPPIEAEERQAVLDAFADCPPPPSPPRLSLQGAKVAALERLAALRREASRNFSFNGMPMELTTQTEDALAKALVSLERQPEGTTVEWEVTRGVFTTMDVGTIGAIGDAAFVHVQTCFANAKAKAALIQAATSLAEIAAVDLDTGWP